MHHKASNRQQCQKAGLPRPWAAAAAAAEGETRETTISRLVWIAYAGRSRPCRRGTSREKAFPASAASAASAASETKRPSTSCLWCLPCHVFLFSFFVSFLLFFFLFFFFSSLFILLSFSLFLLFHIVTFSPRFIDTASCSSLSQTAMNARRCFAVFFSARVPAARGPRVCRSSALQMSRTPGLRCSLIIRVSPASRVLLLHSSAHCCIMQTSPTLTTGANHTKCCASFLLPASRLLVFC